MSIDWFTFAAQIVNFLILVALLRWFLYGPIVRAMSQREEQIAARLEQAEQTQREGEARVQQYEQKLKEIEDQRETALRNARQEADEQRRQLTLETREEVRRKRLEWFQAFEREQEDLLGELQHHAGRLSAEAARRTLQQLASESLEERMFAAFTSRLHELDDQRRDTIKGLLGNGDGNLFVRSAFEVPDHWRARLRAAVRDKFEYEGNIDFELWPDLICGIELQTGGYGFGWNVNEFLRNLETELDERWKAGIGSSRT